MIGVDTWNREAAVDRLDQDNESLIRKRAVDLLAHSSDSVTSELDRARGWLQTQGWLRGGQVTAPSIDWEVEALAGCIGSLSNAWGRLTLWSRANGTYDSVREDLDGVMKDLVDLLTRMLSGSESADATVMLGRAVDEIEDITQTVQAGSAPKR